VLVVYLLLRGVRIVDPPRALPHATGAHRRRGQVDNSCRRSRTQARATCDHPVMRHMVLALVLVAIGGCATPHALGPTDDRAVRDVLETQRDAWNRGDLDGFMAGYERSPNLVFTSGGKIRRGWQETHDKYRAKYGTDKSTMGHLAFEVLAVQVLGADGAIVLGRWRLTETPSAGGGVFSVALVRTAGGWRIVHDHTSVDVAAP